MLVSAIFNNILYYIGRSNDIRGYYVFESKIINCRR